MFRSTRIAALAVVLAALASAPASAQDATPVSLAPADGVTIDADAFPSFSARGGGALTVRLARTPSGLDSCAPVSGNVVEVRGTPTAGDPSPSGVRAASVPGARSLVLAGRSPQPVRARRGAEGDGDARLRGRTRAALSA